MPSVQNRDVTQSHVATVLQTNGLIADSRRKYGVPLPATQALAPNEPVTFDGNIF